MFISSTFRDMQEEREELVKQVFPQLRRLCENRGVTWGEVDLRWGVPDEAKAEGKVLPLCLQEIEHCRPYFIGILGERYGWVPEEIPEALFQTQPWLREHLHQSVTALEIFHGVLLNPEMDKHAFFYFRDPVYAYKLPDFTEENPAMRERLAELKDKIRKSGFPVSEPFSTPKQLGEWVLRDLTAVIEQRYPEKSIPDSLDRDAADHEAYSASRRSVYIGRQKYIDQLDAHAAGEGPPLVVLGESGGGKSALLANWAHNWARQHKETPVLVHFIGASPDSANWMAMLRRLLGEFQRRFSVQIEIPGQADALRMAFANALHMVAAHGRLILVLDALNQIEDRDGAPDLVWLPPIIPADVRLVVSTLPGRSWENLKKRGWPVLFVEPLAMPEREELITKYLARHAKALSLETARRITVAPQTGNGLYLSTLLNELRQLGNHEELEKRIDWYLEAANPIELFRKVIQRWEQDYGKPEPACENIVRESLVRLWAARRGLSETELLESIGAAGSPLPRALWSPLYLAAGDALVNRGGLLTFAHDFLREAVLEGYLPTAGDQLRAHLKLAAYFHAQPQDPRQLEELPRQWQEAGEWQGLAGLLAQPANFRALWIKDEFEMKAYWAQIETHSVLEMEEVFSAVIQHPARNANFAWMVGSLLADTGKLEAALEIRAGLVKHYRELGDRISLQAALGNQAVILENRGDLDSAMMLMKEQESLCRELEDKDGLQTSLGNQALILFARGDLHGAMTLHKEKECLCRELADKQGLQASLCNQANILYSRGDLDGAMALYKEQEILCREQGNKDGLQVSLGNQATILKNRGDPIGAMALHKEVERQCRELGSEEGIQASLANQASILYFRGDIDGAMALCKEQERLCRKLGSKDGLRISLGNQARILCSGGDIDGALILMDEQERLCRELGSKEGLQMSLGLRANVLFARGDLEGAMVMYKEQEQLCRELGNKVGLLASISDQANVLRTRGDLDVAMAMYKEQERLSRELGSEDGIQKSLCNQATILYSRGDLDTPVLLLKEQERLCRELGNKLWLQTSLGNQALILNARGDRGGAMALHKESERICRELGNKDGLQTSLGNQASILFSNGNHDGAMALFKEQERLCRELGKKDGLQNSLGNQGVILHAHGDLDGAMALYKEKERICRELANKDGLQASLGQLAALLTDRGDLEGAMVLNKEKERLCRELGNKNGLQMSLGIQAQILKARGDLEGAMVLNKEKERLCHELGDKDGLQLSLGNQAEILRSQGDLDGAMALFEQKERLCRELGNKDGLRMSLGHQAGILKARGDLDGAMTLYKKQEGVCRELGNLRELSISLANQALILSGKKNRDSEALLLADEALDIATTHSYQELIPLFQRVRSSISAE